jgi:hypothetical protein
MNCFSFPRLLRFLAHHNAGVALLLNKLLSKPICAFIVFHLRPCFFLLGLFFILLRVAVALFCPGEKEDREQILIVIHSLLARFQGRTECVVTGTTSPCCFTWRLAIWQPLL